MEDVCWIKKPSINHLIYDGKKSYSLSKQDSSNILINLDCLDFSYEYDHLFQETTFYSYLKTLKKYYFKVNKDLISNENSNQKSDDSVTSKQEWNYTNDKFTGFGGMEQQRRYDEIKLNFKLN